MIREQYPCTAVMNDDLHRALERRHYHSGCGRCVNAANSQMLGCFVPCHGCIDNAIHSAAGVQPGTSARS